MNVYNSVYYVAHNIMGKVHYKCILSLMLLIATSVILGAPCNHWYHVVGRGYHYHQSIGYTLRYR